MADRHSLFHRKVLPYGRSRLVIGVIFILLYAVSVTFYNRTLPDRADAFFADPPPNGVAVLVIMNEAKFTTDRLTADVEILLGEELQDVSGPAPVSTRDITVTINPVVGRSEFTIPRGTTLPVNGSTTLFMQGAPYTYPFDAYRATFVTTAQEIGEDGALVRLPTIAQMLVPEGFVGWRIKTLYPATEEGLPELNSLMAGEQGSAAIQGRPSTIDGTNWAKLELRRSWSTVFIALFFLFLMVLLTVLSLSTSRAVQIGKKELNIGMTGWLVGLLFAMPALRNLLPGAPPIGSWIDILVFFWAVMAVMISLASFVIYWLRNGPPPPPKEKTVGEDAEHPASTA